jgi:hypothetical protein
MLENIAMLLGAASHDMLSLCTFVPLVIDEVQMPKPQRTRRLTKDVLKKSRPSLFTRGPSNPGFRFRHTDNHGASAWEFFVGDFRDELQVQAETHALLICDIVEKVNDVATKSIFGAAAFIKIEGAGGIHFQVGLVSQDGTELALEVECSLAHLRHGESHYVI